jgi:hypothetical protein
VLTLAACSTHDASEIDRPVAETTPRPTIPATRGVAVEPDPLTGSVEFIGVSLDGSTIVIRPLPSNDACPATQTVREVGLTETSDGAVVGAIAVSLVVLGRWVSSRFDDAWIDACEYGGAGDRCAVGDGSAPSLVLVAWPAAGLLLAGLCAAVIAIARLGGSS